MTKEERNLVRRDQTNNFFNSYFASWRLNQILTIEKLLCEKYSFFKEIAKETKRNDDSSGESTIAQEVTNGLLFDAISIAVQYVEDLFALLHAAKKPDYFIRNISTYKAGKIENTIREEHSLKSICQLFYFPYFDDLDEGYTSQRVILECYKIIEQYLGEIQTFYKTYHFFYIQYKHGLTVALRPFGPYNRGRIINEKKGKHKPYLVAFDNVALNRVVVA